MRFKVNSTSFPVCACVLCSLCFTIIIIYSLHINKILWTNRIRSCHSVHDLCGCCVRNRAYASNHVCNRRFGGTVLRVCVFVCDSTLTCYTCGKPSPRRARGPLFIIFHQWIRARAQLWHCVTSAAHTNARTRWPHQSRGEKKKVARRCTCRTGRAEAPRAHDIIYAHKLAVRAHCA